MSWTKRILLAVLVLLVLIQLVPVNRSNPEGASTLLAPEGVVSLVSRACYDCHSNETSWPWYSYVAPVSWLLANHVHEGREYLNFSSWNTLSSEEQAHMAEEMLEEMEKGAMPLPMYRWLHSDARPTEADIALVGSWAVSLER